MEKGFLSIRFSLSIRYMLFNVVNFIITHPPGHFFTLSGSTLFPSSTGLLS